MANRKIHRTVDETLGQAIRRYYQHRALSRVAQAIKAGCLPRPGTLPCAYCGGHALIYEHRDYHEPLTVVPACDSCNHKLPPATIDPITVIDHLAGRCEFPLRMPDVQRAKA